jgi:maltooligosyltrehalose trehalohydrolase
MQVGAEIVAGEGVHFRVWAPQRRTVEVVIENESAPQSFELQPEPNGYFSGIVMTAKAGTRYRYRLDGGDRMFHYTA